MNPWELKTIIANGFEVIWIAVIVGAWPLAGSLVPELWLA